MNVLFSHPIIGAIATLIGIFTFYLAINRITQKHFAKTALVSKCIAKYKEKHNGKPPLFMWKRHVFWGSIAFVFWYIAIILGFYFAYTEFGGSVFENAFVTPTTHYMLAIFITVLGIFAYGSGVLLNKNKGKYKILPIAHGLACTTIVVMAIIVCINGLGFLDMISY